MPRDWITENVRNAPRYGMVEISRYVRSLRLKDLINLNVGEPDFDTPRHVREAAIKAIQENKTHYTQSEGLPELRQAISTKLRKQNSLDYSSDQITVVSGTQEGISVISQTIFGPGDEVIVTDPFFPAYVQNIALQGSKPVFMPLPEEDGYHIASDSELRKIISPKTKALIMVSPNNPTGAMQGYEHLKLISEIAIAHDLLVISDEIYENIAFGANKHCSIASLPGMKERTIIQNGFSKSYAMTGWRVGYFAAPEQVSPKLQQVHRSTAICPPSVSQYAALAALEGPQECVGSMTAEFARRKDIIVKMLKEIPNVSLVEPEGAFYVFPNFTYYAENNDEEFAREIIRETHVAVLPGSSFGAQGRGHLRISFAASEERIEEGLSRIQSYLHRRK